MSQEDPVPKIAITLRNIKQPRRIGIEEIQRRIEEQDALIEVL
jgi:hypothetical protein